METDSPFLVPNAVYGEFDLNEPACTRYVLDAPKTCVQNRMMLWSRPSGKIPTGSSESNKNITQRRKDAKKIIYKFIGAFAPLRYVVLGVSAVIFVRNRILLDHSSSPCIAFFANSPEGVSVYFQSRMRIGPHSGSKHQTSQLMPLLSRYLMMEGPYAGPSEFGGAD